MKLYIVIPHFIITEEVAQLARNTIKSFKDTSDCIIVNCDDCSPYDTTFLEESPDIYIRNEENLGFAGNCNVGFRWIMEHEKEDCYIVCANNDIEVYPHWFEHFKVALEHGKGHMVGGLGVRDKYVDGMNITEYERNPGSRFAGQYITEGGRLDDWMFPGGFYMTTKKSLEEEGLYDEGFIHGGYEDIDLFLRFKEHGKRLIMTPKVIYWHKEGATRFSEESNQRGRQAEVEPLNRQYFINKWKFQPHQNILQFMVDNRINL